jgi:hypothetical protein
MSRAQSGVGKSLLSMGLAAVTANTSGTAYLIDIDPHRLWLRWPPGPNALVLPCRNSRGERGP